MSESMFYNILTILEFICCGLKVDVEFTKEKCNLQDDILITTASAHKKIVNPFMLLKIMIITYWHVKSERLKDTETKLTKYLFFPSISLSHKEMTKFDLYKRARLV